MTQYSRKSNAKIQIIVETEKSFSGASGVVKVSRLIPSPFSSQATSDIANMVMALGGDRQAQYHDAPPSGCTPCFTVSWYRTLCVATFLAQATTQHFPSHTACMWRLGVQASQALLFLHPTSRVCCCMHVYLESWCAMAYSTSLIAVRLGSVGVRAGSVS